MVNSAAVPSRKVPHHDGASWQRMGAAAGWAVSMIPGGSMRLRQPATLTRRRGAGPTSASP